MSDDVVLTRRAGRVGQVLLNRPTSRNAVTVALALALAQGLERAVRSLADEVDVIVLRGAGGTFCAGGDVEELVQLSAAGREGLARLLVPSRAAISAIAQVRLVRRARARGLILTGDTISGSKAVGWRLAYRSAPAAGFASAVDDVVPRLLRGSRPALAASKRLVRMADQLPLEAGLDAEPTTALDHLTSPAGAAALAAFTDRER